MSKDSANLCGTHIILGHFRHPLLRASRAAIVRIRRALVFRTYNGLPRQRHREAKYHE